MKKCPNCYATYSDDLSFCLNDGSVLVSLNEQETVLITKKTEPVSFQPHVKQGVSPIFAYLTIGLLALLVGGGAIAWIMSRNNLPENVSTKKESESNEKPSKTEKPNINSPETPTPQPLTTETVQNLLSTWELTQDTRNYSKYRDCYDISFSGVKRTNSGDVYNFNYVQWMNDRKKMYSKAKFINVRIDKQKISIQGDIATVEFDQYFVTNGYGDFGPKIMKIRMTEKGAKIIYEELKSSVPLTD
jgi:hypothetical protein